MTNREARALIVIAILIIGVGYLRLDKTPTKTSSGTVLATPADAATTTAAVPTTADGEVVNDTGAPFVDKIDEQTPIVRFLRGHPTALGRETVAELSQQKAVVLVGLDPAEEPSPDLMAWLKECSDYCDKLAKRIDIDPGDESEKLLLAFFGAEELKPPFLVGIAPSGEVKKLVSNVSDRKDVIDVFAEVTGSCGVNCTDPSACD